MSARLHHDLAIERLDVMGTLALYDPHVAGTLPLALNVADSDIDILCHAPDAVAFAQAAWAAFARLDGFALYQWGDRDRPVIVRFHAEGWDFEIFGSAHPVMAQEGWRHFCIERRLLNLGGSAFRDAVMRLRRAGAKTEPAVAALLGLAGNPYESLLQLESCTDTQLIERLNPAVR